MGAGWDGYFANRRITSLAPNRLTSKAATTTPPMTP
jgi:hypothetical protein